MPSYDEARDRLRRLTKGIVTALPKFCEMCCRRLEENQEISVLQRRASIRVVHKQCRGRLTNFGYAEAENG